MSDTLELRFPVLRDRSVGALYALADSITTKRGELKRLLEEEIPANRRAIKEAREQWLAPMEREYLARLLRSCDGDLDAAAERAGLHRKSLERLMRQHNLRASDRK